MYWRRSRQAGFVVVCIIFISFLLLLHDPSCLVDNPRDQVKPSRLPFHGRFTSPNQILKSTAIGVKTFNRPECLKEFLLSVRTFAPYLTVFVVDDSYQDARFIFLNGTDQGDIYIMLPTDSGTAYGRNRIVEAIHRAKYEYLIMADDDFKITSPETIPMMAKHLLETGADVVAATRCDINMDNCKRNKGMIVMDNHRNLSIVPNVTAYPGYPEAPDCTRSDLVQQFFIARTSSLLNVHWDDHLKNNDHYDFLFAAKLNNLSLVTCNDVQVLHEKSCESQSIYSDTYKETRKDRWNLLLTYVLKKWKLERIYDEVGKQFFLDQQAHAVSEDGETIKYYTSSPNTRTLITDVVDSMNGYQPGWNWIRPIFSSKSWVMRKQFGQCVHLISGNVEIEFDRYRTFANKVSTTRFSQFMFEENCPYAEQMWQFREYGRIERTRHVYYVTAIANDNDYMRRLLTNLNADNKRPHITLIVVIMDNDSRIVIQQMLEMFELRVVLIDAGPPFSRSIGLSLGFQKAILLAAEHNHQDAIGFAVDTSILMPPTFSQRIRFTTQCGLSAFVPIVFKCMSCNNNNLFNRTDGYWVYSGFGMIALCLEDYVKIGGWNTTWGYKWGAEDVDIIERTERHLPYIHRAKETEYLHVRDPAIKKNNPSYYGARNLFPRHLPPNSLTRRVENPEMANRVFEFSRKYLPEMDDQQIGRKELHATYTRDAKGILYYLTVKEQDIWVLVYSYLSPIILNPPGPS